MKNSTSRFFCWVLAIASILVSILILAAPIFEFDLTLIRTLNLPWCFRPDATLMDFVEIPWCAVALFSPCILLLIFALTKGENLKSNLCWMLLPLALLGFAIICSSPSDSSDSERMLELLLSAASSIFYIVSSFSLFCSIINEDSGSSDSSGSSRDRIDELLSDMTGEESGGVDTTGATP